MSLHSFYHRKKRKVKGYETQGLSIRAIARILNRSPSSVSREFRRNSYASGDYALIMLTNSIISVEEIAVENRCSETVPFVIVSLRK